MTTLLWISSQCFHFNGFFYILILYYAWNTFSSTVFLLASFQILQNSEIYLYDFKSCRYKTRTLNVVISSLSAKV